MQRRHWWLFGAAAAAALAGGVAVHQTAQAPVAQTCHMRGPLPDSRCTPGVLNPDVTQATIGVTICTPGWAAAQRPSTSVTDRIKRERIAVYGMANVDPKTLELDHLAAIEIGGALADPANLWPQVFDGPLGAHTKDVVETATKTAVCRGEMSLTDAQRKMVTDWVALGRELGVLQ